MALVNIKQKGYKCNRCSHEWVPRKGTVGEPRVCPKCKSPYWNKPRKNARKGAMICSLTSLAEREGFEPPSRNYGSEAPLRLAVLQTAALTTLPSLR